MDPVDDMCAGLDFCILNAGKYKETELETMIRKHGGHVVKNPGPKTYACIADSSSHKVKMAISSQKYNIATADWLCRSFGGNTVLQSLPRFQPLEMVHATDDLKLKFIDNFDIYGDSYTGKISNEEFKAFSSKMNIELIPVYTKSELYELETELWLPQEPPKIFRFLTAHFLPIQKNDESYMSYELAQFMFTTKAGRILKASDDSDDSFLSMVTHIFVNENNWDLAQLPSWRRNGGATQTKIVSYKWILGCCEANKKISDQHFIYNEI